MDTKTSVVLAVCVSIALGWLVSVHEQQDTFEELVHWVRSQNQGAGPGFVHDSIQLKQLDHYGGSLVNGGSVAIPAGEVVIKIPIFSLILDSYVWSDLNPIPNDELNSDDWPVNMAGFIMHEQSKGDRSGWFQFFQTLPSSMFLPYQLSDEKLAILNTTSPELVRSSLAHKEFLKQRYSDVVQVLFKPYIPGLSFEWFERTMFFLQSRSFVVFVQDDDNEWQEHLALVPLVDLMNTAHPSTLLNIECETDVKSEFFVCKTMQAVEPGEQLFVEYGAAMRHSQINHYLIRNYGFTFAPIENETLLTTEDIQLHDTMQKLRGT